ncbi:MAG: uracil-DNA glycosylase [Pseudomonadota bacterium]
MTEKTSETALKALTGWWQDMGVPPDPAIMRAFAKLAESPDLPSAKAQSQAAPSGSAPQRRKTAKTLGTWIEEAKALAAACQDITALAQAISAFEGCPLKQGCRNTVVFDGIIGAPIMVIGEGPGSDEDQIGKPFIGRAGQLLDQMLASIAIYRSRNALITNVNYWRPPRNRNPELEELAVCRPFVDRMIELAAPKLVITAGAVPSQSLLDTKTGITRLRGNEKRFATPGGTVVPLIPILHPAFLLRRPQEKSRAWRDLLLIEERARALGALD